MKIKVERVYRYVDTMCSLYDHTMPVHSYPFPLIAINSDVYNNIIQSVLYFAHDAIDWGEYSFNPFLKEDE